MRAKDHLRLIAELSRQSIVGTILVVGATLLGLLGLAFELFLTESEKDIAAEVIRRMLSHWQYLVILALAIICAVLYRRLIPRVSIDFDESEARFCTLIDGHRTFRVDLTNHGDWLDNVSFRLEYIQDSDGNTLPYDRLGFQREAGKGPMPLSPNSPKYGYIARLDEIDPDSRIEILTISDVATGYHDEPIQLDRGSYFVTVSLNPRVGRPCHRRYRIWIESDQLKMSEAG